MVDTPSPASVLRNAFVDNGLADNGLSLGLQRPPRELSVMQAGR